MSLLNSPSTRSLPVKQQRIVETLRSQIVSGHFPAGGRLPTNAILSKKFNVSNVTVLRALDVLSRDGFVVARGRNGTFVTDHPPHLWRVGLVFHTDQAHDGRWRVSRFLQGLVAEAGRVEARTGRPVSIYGGVDVPPQGEGARRLTEDLAAHRLAGLILVAPANVLHSPVLKDVNLPIVGVGSNGGDARLGAVRMAKADAVALDYLKEAGVKRLAVLETGLRSPAENQAYQQRIANLGMQSRPEWILSVKPEEALTARYLTRLLMDLSEDRRPDGLYIADDNLAEYATGGLIDAGVSVPSQVKVVAHCNFPWPTPTVVQVCRIGYDLRSIFDKAVEIIDNWHNLTPEQREVEVPVVFEDPADAPVG